MNQVDKSCMHKIEPLFDGWDETLLWSCLQGYMGNAWADNVQDPESAQIITGDFCFFCGKAEYGTCEKHSILFSGG